MHLSWSRQPGQLSRYRDSLQAGRSRPDRPRGPSRLLYNGVKRPGRGADHPPQSSSWVKERIELYLYLPSLPNWPCNGTDYIISFKTFLSYKYVANSMVGTLTMRSETQYGHFVTCIIMSRDIKLRSNWLTFFIQISNIKKFKENQSSCWLLVSCLQKDERGLKSISVSLTQSLTFPLSH